MGRARRIVIGTAGTLATAVGLIGVLHMPFARHFLMDIGGCPVSHASLAEMEPTTRAAVKAELGTAPAPARPALGFDLDKTTRAVTDAWADRNHVSCREQREGLLFCKNVPATALGLADVDGPVSEIHFGFNTKGVLVDVSTMRLNTSLQPAQDIESQLAKEVGVPQKKNGTFDAAHLAQTASISTLSYHYSNYVAELTALRFPTTGLVVREHYMSAND